MLDYDPEADKWTKVGEMANARYYHGMSLVPKETADYCVPERCMELTEYLNY